MAKRISIYQVKLEKVKSFHYGYDEKQIKMPRDVADIFRHYFETFCSTDRENFIVMFLNTKNRIVGVSTVHVGSLDSSIVHPREVYTEALLHKAASIIVCHNHPSGDVSPSREDVAVTRNLQQAGELLGISVLDHIILGENTYYSLKERGDM
ncbi:DNA repair protein RadC [Brevibacillus brevis]|uniref:DNA repair protein RadC n=1 Tax=Brevibacillus brevis TaxID=1393 RepID=A0ABY9TD31_BREBE|nr:DNA repair protein RadC [Brevibacillus brevis]WNC17883.1 DNA repair protein RadC [Brevibacillus brevis]